MYEEAKQSTLLTFKQWTGSCPSLCSMCAVIVCRFDIERCLSGFRMPGLYGGLCGIELYWVSRTNMAKMSNHALHQPMDVLAQGDRG